MIQFQAKSRLTQTNQAVAEIREHWKNSPEIFVFNGMSDPNIPPEVLSVLKSRGRRAQPSGFIFNRKVFINAAKMSTDVDVAQTLLHECIGHFGLQSVFGSDLARELQDLIRLRPNDIENVRSKFNIPDTEEGRLEAAEEVLANLAETKPNLTLVQSAGAAIFSWIRRTIPPLKNLRLSQAEIIKRYILPARAFVENKPLRAPNGESSQLTRMQWLQVRTKAFKDWFGDWERSPQTASQILDENGEPRVMYRGERDEFSVFDANKAKERGVTGRSGDYFFFTSDPENARFYAEDDSGVKGYFLNVRNPLAKSGMNPRKLANMATSENFQSDGDTEFDGALSKETLDGSHVSDIVVIFPDEKGTTNQVKSAEGNSGGFSAINADINFRESTAEENFNAWFKGSKIVDSYGEPLKVYHGTTNTVTVPGKSTPGDDSAIIELKALAAKFGIEDWTSVPSVLERWVSSSIAEQFGANDEIAKRARALYEKSKGTYTKPTVALGFDAFHMPYGSKELGAHFGTKAQASSFGDVFEFYLSLRNPLRLPDLGTWDSQNVMREARKKGVQISESEYEKVFNANDENKALRELFISKGVDGIIYSNEAEGKGDSYIAFNPEQIKSATDNSGDYDSLNANVRFSRTTFNDNLTKWFGKSEITDSKGHPKVVYHGSRSDFNVFNGKDGFNFFSESPKGAEIYANGSGGGIYPAFIRIEKPLDLTNVDLGEEVTRSKASKVLRVPEYLLPKPKFGKTGHLWEFFDDQVRRYLSSFFDGIKTNEDGHEAYITFKPEQIKSAIGNNGDFDGNNPDIRFRQRTTAGDPKFLKWFEDSTVVDADGKPLVVYHGTISDFSTFDIDKSGASNRFGPGFYFSGDKKTFDTYGGREGGNVMPVFLSMKNPQVGSALTQTQIKNFFSVLQDKVFPNGYDATADQKKFEQRALENPDKAFDTLLSAQTGYISQADWLRGMDAIGVDGIVREVFGHPEYVVFKPAQIKSVLGNNGQFDPLNPDIRFKKSLTTDNLKRWFGKSKVVDSKGAPLMVYHGTQSSFSEFDPELQGSTVWSEDVGFFFTNNPAEANSYAQLDWDKEDPQPNLMPVYLSIQNPMVIDISDEERPGEVAGTWYDEYGREAAAKALDEGYDGLIIGDFSAEASLTPTGINQTMYVAFKPEQIKSAIGNNGEFDPLNADIRFRQSTREEGFSNWFGTSKTVNKDGTPRVFYHGSTADITAFDENKLTEKDSGWYGRGIYLTSDPAAASAYAGYESLQGKELKGRPRVIPAFVALKNPYFWPKGRKAALSHKEAQAMRSEIEAAGHDGVIVANDYADPEYADQYEVIAFKASQIKSSIGNNGDFDANNNDIRFKESDSAGSAIQEFRSNPRIKILQDRGLSFDFSIVKGTVSLDNIEVMGRQFEGIGSEALQILTSIADRHDVAITLEVGGGSDSIDLPAWYARHGFEWKDSFMERPPQHPSKDEKPLTDWITGTAVVDDKGNPKVMYHGSSVGEMNGLTIGVIEQFDRLFTQKIFRRNPTPDHIGSWFSDNPSQEGGAGMYTPQDSGVMYPVYLAIKNPWEVSFAGLRRQCNKYSGLPIDEWDTGWPTNEGINQLRAWMEEVGLDGIRIMHDPLALNESTEFEKQDVFIAIHPWQIRSAIGQPLRELETEKEHEPSDLVRFRFTEESFSESFADSKLRTPSGVPKVFYHGTTAPAFDQFKPSTEGQFGSGIYLSGDAKSASSYAEDEGGHVLPVYVCLKNPLYIKASYEAGLEFDIDSPAIPLLSKIYDKSTFQMRVKQLSESTTDMLSAEVEKQVKSLGYDGIVMTWDDGITDCVAYDPNAVAFALSTPQSEVAKLQQASQGPIWVSSLIKAMEQSNSTQATVEGWKNTIKGLVKKGIVKQDEVDWSTVNEWLDLQTGKVTASSLLSYLNGHALDIKESILIPVENELSRANYALRDTPYMAILDNIEEEIFFAERETGDYLDYSDLPEDVQEIINRLSETTGESAKFKQYAIHGGEDYREILLFLPTFDEEKVKSLRRMASRIDAFEELEEEFARIGAPSKSQAFKAKAELLKSEFREFYAKTRNTKFVKNFHDGHWSSTPNILAHARVTTRYDQNGAKTLFVEEIQSDWAQMGRKEGFGRELAPLSTEDLDEMAKLDLMDWKSRTSAETSRLNDLRHREKTLMTTGAPPAPFVEKTDSWVSLMVKRLIRLATDENFEQIAFISGEQSSERYGLQKTVESVRAAPLGDDTYNLAIFNRDGEAASGNHLGITIAEVSQIVGKELATKIKNSPIGEISTFEGTELKVGGHGMTEFYDKIVPSVVKKLLTRATGFKLEPIQFNKSIPNGWEVQKCAGGWVVINEAGEAMGSNRDKEEAIKEATKDLGSLKEQLSFAITPAIKEMVSHGMPMFQEALPPVAKAELEATAEVVELIQRPRQRAA